MTGPSEQDVAPLDPTRVRRATWSIREACADDLDQIVGLSVAAGLFAVDDSDLVRSLVGQYARARRDEGHLCLVAVSGAEALAVVYCRPEPATSGTHQMLMLAVAPDDQRLGVGRTIVAAAEKALDHAGGRLLLVQTLATPDFHGPRAFYRACGFQQAAVIEGYYNDGLDMVLFRKDLRRRE